MSTTVLLCAMGGFLATGCSRCAGTQSLRGPLGTFADIAGLAGMELGLEMPPQAETAESIRAIADRVHRAVTVGREPVAALNEVVFGRLAFAREVNDEDPRFVLLPTVLQETRGTCVGLAQVYLAVAGQLDLTLHAVLAPGHLFVRQGERNIELLRQGEVMPDAWYRETYALPAHVDAYMRPLTPEEMVAVLHFNIGNALRRQQKVQDALHHYNAAIVRFESWPEAHASRGLTLQLLGDVEGARRAYARAFALHPELSGLVQNMRALDAERGKGAVAQ